MELFERLTELIRALGMTKKNFAKRVKVAPRSLAYYCKGTKTPGAKVIQRVIEATHVSPAWLMEGKGDMFPASGGTALAVKRPEEEKQEGGYPEMKIIELREKATRILRSASPFADLLAQTILGLDTSLDLFENARHNSPTDDYEGGVP